MIKNIDNPQNKERIAIVAIGYNRLSALKRLLQSLNEAHYANGSVPLVISIDASGDLELYNYVNQFVWNYGEKYVNIQQERLGLKKHIFQCFSLSKYFKGVILLEDDIFVSPYFYHYANETIRRYGNEEKVAGISFYTNEYNGFHGLPQQFINNGNDVFAWQSVCSWGEMMNERMWSNFENWMLTFDGSFDKFDMNDVIKGWTRAWSKYVYAYMLQTDTYFIYPYQPLTTNFNDAGGEHGGGSSIVQVSLIQGRHDYQLGDFSELEHYDVYGYNKDMYKWLNIDESELTVDFYGDHYGHSGRYLLTTSTLPYKKIRGFGLCMRPWELNVKYSISGNDIILYERSGNETERKSKITCSYDFIMYHLQRYQQHITFKLLLRRYLKSLLLRFKF